MANLQVKKIPDSLHKRLRKEAEKKNRTMSEIVIEAIERELERREWLMQAPKKSKTDLSDL
jgi:predicted transcriptional regulator